ncbi:MAG: hypothetical protein GF355_11485, partial [Candidatus Eisenbacteria bacterium]|nr:hypothetical protein [Candidatus Eisenbacteria bacterium]
MREAAGQRVKISILLASALAFMALPAMAGEEETVDGVVHVKNGATPSEGVETIELEELWSIGGADDEETVLGVVVQATVDEEGNVYLLDMQLAQVLVYSPEGEFLKTLSRQGEGPGEVQNPADMLFMPDGTLGLLQTFPGKLVKVNLDDTPAGEVIIGGDPTQGGFAVVVDAKCRGGNLVMAGTDISQGDGPTQQVRTSYLASYAEDGTKKVRYWESALKLDFTNLKIHERDQYNVFPRRWALGPHGRVYAAVEREDFVINVYEPDGTLTRVIEKEFSNRERTAEEKAFYEQLVEVQTRQFQGADITLCETPEAISYIELAPDGTIWVADSRSEQDQPEGIMTTYHVFRPDGHYLKQAQIACDANGQDDGLIRIG